MCSGGEFVSG